MCSPTFCWRAVVLFVMLKGGKELTPEMEEEIKSTIQSPNLMA
jgi:hypothetical protein